MEQKKRKKRNDHRRDHSSSCGDRSSGVLADGSFWRDSSVKAEEIARDDARAWRCTVFHRSGQDFR